MKTIGNLRKINYGGVPKLSWHFIFTATAYNPVRMKNLGAAATYRGERPFSTAR